MRSGLFASAMLSLLLMLFTLSSGTARGDLPLQPSGETGGESLTRPPGTDLLDITYDAESNKAILFGGDAGGNRGPITLGDVTWAYDFATETWTDMNAPTGPRGRWSHRMAYDSESDRVILFGGDTSDSQDFSMEENDTWAYDFNTNSWTEMNPASRPSERDRHAMTYDSESDRIVLFGGQLLEGGHSNETWAYDFNADIWTRMNPSASPSAGSFRMVYDSSSDRVILFGGWRYVPDLEMWTTTNETWAYDFNADIWTQMHAANAPSPRTGFDLAYDSESDRVILFGGGYPRTNETWAYDYNTNTWTEMSPSVRPSARRIHGLTYAVGPDRVVLFGGQLSNGIREDDAWAYDFNTDIWTDVSPPRTPYWTAPHGTGTLRVRAGDGEIELTWRPADNDGGSPITGYRVYRNTARTDLVPLFEVDNVLSFVDTGLVDGTAYFYRVSPMNAIGEGPLSNIAYATPEDTTSPVVAITSPSDGAILTSVNVAVNGTAVDNVGVETVEISVDGTNWRLISVVPTWSVVLTLREGPNTIYVRATDVWGNEETVTIQVTVDLTPPIDRPGTDISPIVIPALVTIVGIGALASALLILMRLRGKRDL